MRKDYIIHGITKKNDEAFSECISTSFKSNINEKCREFKNSLKDIRSLARAYCKENSNNDYFYSIEKINDSVLYTIYCTNWFTKDARLSYHALTLIIDCQYIIEDPLNHLKSLIKQYDIQAKSGFGESSLDLKQVHLTINNTIRSISTKYKEGYLQYNSEIELNSLFLAKRNKLHNFNKVFFFSNTIGKFLEYLNVLVPKFHNLNDYQTLPINLENYDNRYYRISVDDHDIEIIDKNFNAYEGEKIKIFKKGKLSKTYRVDLDTRVIKLDKIKKSKPRKGISIGDMIFYSVISLISLIMICIVFEQPLKKNYNKLMDNSINDLLGLGNKNDSTIELRKQKQKDTREKELVAHLDKFFTVLEDGKFSDKLKDPKTYNQELKERNAIHDKYDKLENYKKFKRDQGYKPSVKHSHFWRLDKDFILSKSTSDNSELFVKLTSSIDEEEGLSNMLQKYLPKGICDSIFKHDREMYSRKKEVKKEDKKEEKKQEEKQKDQQENKDQDKKEEKKQEEQQKEDMSKEDAKKMLEALEDEQERMKLKDEFERARACTIKIFNWKGQEKTLDNLAGKESIVNQTKISKILLRMNDKISEYKKCGCLKCISNLEKPIIKIINEKWTIGE